jgi:AraC-like DNA-binding protein
MPVASSTATAIVEGLALLGLDASRIGVQKASNDAALSRLWNRAIAVSQRRTIPLEVGLSLPVGAMGAIDYLASTSTTVGAALTVTQAVFSLVGPGVQLLFERSRSGGWRLVINDQPQFPGQIESDNFVLGILLSRLRRFASRTLQLPRVELTEPKPTEPERWRGLLAVERIRFGAPQASICLTATDWATPLVNSDPRLFSTLSSMVGIEQPSDDALLIAVRTLAQQRLPAVLTLGIAAPSLGITPRTLQRRLAARGTSLSQVVDDVRRTQAEQLVTDGGLVLGIVAKKLGFAEQASFTRAWCRWFGVPPTRHLRPRVHAKNSRA